MVTLLRLLISLYQRTLSPLLPRACRFHPSCSHYASEALLKHGALRGSWLTLARLARCQPFCAGGLDPVPEPFSWAPWRKATQQVHT